MFEHQWGSKQDATAYAELSEKTASWLFSLQDNQTQLATFGGFPHSDYNSTQIAEENGVVLLGVDTYYSIISVLAANPKPSIWDARRVMQNWVSGFAERMQDPHGGTYNSRTSASLIQYPKTTRATAWILQALVDIWINIGGDRYYRDAQKPYDWLVGGNELSTDMQGASSISGAIGGFYHSITEHGLDRTSRTDITASTLYSFVRAGFVQIPEFPKGGQAIFVLAVLVAVLGAKRVQLAIRRLAVVGSQPCQRRRIHHTGSLPQ